MNKCFISNLFSIDNLIKSLDIIFLKCFAIYHNPRPNITQQEYGNAPILFYPFEQGQVRHNLQISMNRINF